MSFRNKVPTTIAPGPVGRGYGRSMDYSYQPKVKDVVNMFGEPGRFVDWDSGRDFPRTPLQPLESPVHNFGRTIESMYANRDLTNVSTSIFHTIFLAKSAWTQIPYRIEITYERNFTVFNVMFDIIPFQYRAHGVPGRTMSMRGEEYAFSMTTQNAAIEMDTRVLQDPIHGPTQLAYAVYGLGVSAQETILIRQFNDLVMHGAKVALQGLLRQVQSGSVSIQSDELILYFNRSLAAANKGPDRYIPLMVDALKDVDSTNNGGYRLIVTTENFQSILAERISQEAATKSYDYRVFVEGVESIVGPTSAPTLEQLGIKMLRNIPNTGIVEMNDIPINDRVSVRSQLYGITTIGEFFYSRGLAGLEHNNVHPNYNPTLVNVYSHLEDKRVPITMTNVVKNLNIFNTAGDGYSTDVINYIRRLKRSAPFSADAGNRAWINEQARSLKPVDRVVSGIGEGQPAAFLFSFWSEAMQKYTPVDLIAQFDVENLPTPVIERIGEHAMQKFKAFGDASMKVLTWINDMSNREWHPSWAKAIYDENKRRLWTVKNGKPFLRLEYPAGRNQPYAVVGQFPGNIFGGMDLPSAPTSNTDGNHHPFVESRHVGAGYANGPGFLTFAREATTTNTAYAAIAKAAAEARDAWMSAWSDMNKAFGESLFFRGKHVSSWFTTKSSATALTRFIECCTSARPMFLGIEGPSRTGVVDQPSDITNIPNVINVDGFFVSTVPDDFYKYQYGLGIAGADISRITSYRSQFPIIIRTADQAKITGSGWDKMDIQNKERALAVFLASSAIPAGATPVDIAGGLKKWLDTPGTDVLLDAARVVHEESLAKMVKTAIGSAKSVPQPAGFKALTKGIVDARWNLIKALVDAGFVETPEMLRSTFVQNPKLNAAGAVTYDASDIELQLKTNGATIQYNTIVNAVITARNAANAIAAVGRLLNTADGKTTALIQAINDYIVAIQAYGQGTLALVNFSKENRQSTIPSAVDAGEIAFIRVPLTSNNKSVAHSAYSVRAGAQPRILVGNHDTGYGTPALDLDDAWIDETEKSTAVAAYVNAVNTKAVLIGGAAAPPSPGNKQSPPSPDLGKRNRFARSKPENNTSPRSSQKSGGILYRDDDEGNQPLSFGDDMMDEGDNDGMDFEDMAGGPSSYQGRAAEAYRGEAGLSAQLGRESNFLGFDLFENALFQRPDLNTAFLDPTTIQRLEEMQKEHDGSSTIDQKTLFELIYMLTPVTASAISSMSRANIVPPFDWLGVGWHTFETCHTIVCTEGLGTLFMTPPYSALSVDNKIDMSYVLARLEGVIIPNRWGGAQLIPNPLIKRCLGGLNGLIFTPAELKALTEGSHDGIVAVDAPSIIVMAISLMAPRPSVLRWDGDTPSDFAYQVANVNVPGSSYSRFSTQHFYQTSYPGIGQLINGIDAPILDYLRDLDLTEAKLTDADDSLVPMMMKGTGNGFCNYIMRGPWTAFNPITGDEEIFPGNGPLGQPECQAPGCKAVYDGEIISFPSGPQTISRTYTTH